MMNILVLGAGSYGTALAVAIALNGHQVQLYDRNPKRRELLKKNRENKQYLNGVFFPDQLSICEDLDTSCQNSQIIFCAVPAQSFRALLTQIKPNINSNAIIVNVAKGIEKETLLTMHQVFQDVCPGYKKYVALAGPTYASELAKGLPTVLTVAALDEDDARCIQDIVTGNYLRVYTSDDIMGVELGGALKNIYAIAVGISDGMGFGDNAKAGLMTRGIHELIRLGMVVGAKERTFSGLTGLGDMIVSCTGALSRNRKCGLLLASGLSVEAAKEKIGTVVEGLSTLEAAVDLAKKHDIDMPIAKTIYSIVKEDVSIEQALNTLMKRSKKSEII